MMGRHHLAVNAAVAATFVVTTAAGMKNVQNVHGLLNRSLMNVMVPERVTADFSAGFTYNVIVFCVGACFFFWFGSLLPDIDSKNSTLGRKFHLPFKHRTWTHTIWPCLLLLIPAWFMPWFRWLLFGYILHLVGDAVSSAGICFTYPMKKYIEYPGGAFVAPDHKVKLYRTNDSSEIRFVILVVLVCIVLCYLSRSGINYLLDWIFI